MVAVLVLCSFVAVACQPSDVTGLKRSTVGARCSGKAVARDATRVLQCRRGRFAVMMPIATAVRLINQYNAEHAPPPPASVEDTSWIATTTCFKGAAPMGDFKYVGPVNTLGNFVRFASFVIDGTCPGPAQNTDGAIVRASDQTAATAICRSLKPTSMNLLVFKGTTVAAGMPDDSYMCA